MENCAKIPKISYRIDLIVVCRCHQPFSKSAIMDSLGGSDALTQLQNLDPAAKLELQKVIQQENQKAEVQKSIPPR